MPLDEMLVFARVVEHQSFAGAARQLGLTTSAVSRSVGRLEAQFGLRLLQRHQQARLHGHGAQRRQDLPDQAALDDQPLSPQGGRRAGLRPSPCPGRISARPRSVAAAPAHEGGPSGSGTGFTFPTTLT
jgi:hypothetical protein